MDVLPVLSHFQSRCLKYNTNMILDLLLHLLLHLLEGRSLLSASFMLPLCLLPPVCHSYIHSASVRLKLRDQQQSSR